MTPQDLIKAFEDLADAPDGVKRLRELVLQLAVRGKLVEQKPEDESASCLLIRIAAARKAVGGRPSKGGPIADDETPFDVPATWEWVRFGDIFECRLGKMLDKAKNRGTARPYLRNANVRWGSFDLSDVLEMRLEDDELPDVTVRRGDLVVCEGGEPGRAAVFDADEPFVIQKALHRARPYLVDSRYYQIHLRVDCASGRVAGLFTGATIMHLTGQMLDRHTVTLPPLPEQQRIVARVDELMDLLDKVEATRNARDEARRAARDSALASLRDAEDSDAVEAAWSRIAHEADDLFTGPEDVEPLRQAILGLAVRGRLSSKEAHYAYQDGPFAIPAHWRWEPLRALSLLVTSGSRSWNQYYAARGASFIRSQDIKLDRLEYDNRVYVELPGDVEGTRTKVERGDWLITITGANVGKCAWMGRDPGEAYVSQHVALIRPRDLSLGQFVHLWLTADEGGRGLLLGSSYGAKPGLNLDQLRSLVVPVPPPEERDALVETVGTYLTMASDLEARLAAARDFHGQFAAAAVHHLDA